jgi:hypothetical protein
VANAREVTAGGRLGDALGRAVAEALTPGRPALARTGSALASLKAGFSWFGFFRGRIFWFSPAISGVLTGFSRFVMLFEKFIDLGGNWNEKSSIPREIRGIGARKFVAM